MSIKTLLTARLFSSSSPDTEYFRSQHSTLSRKIVPKIPIRTYFRLYFYIPVHVTNNRMDSVLPGWTNVRPEADEEGFTQRSTERRQLFEETKARRPCTELPPVVWALFQVGDLEQVKTIAQTDTLWMLFADCEYPDGPTSFEGDSLDMVRLWKQKPAERTKAATPKRPIPEDSFNPVPSSPLRPDVATQTSSHSTRSKRKHGMTEYSPMRSVAVAARCKERDGNLCAVSRMEAIDAAHIYPWCAFGEENTDRVRNFWKVLKMFWKREVVESWRGKIFVDQNVSNRGTETVENMLSLTATLHRFHSSGVFALRPIQMSEDKTQLELEFHWLVVEERKSTQKVDLLDKPLSSANRKLSGKGYGPFFRIDPTNADQFTQLVSGTRFTLSTDDAVNKPLPDPGLLALQWHLQRILAMSGAAGWKEEQFDNDDDNDGLGVGVRDAVAKWLEDTPGPSKDDRQNRTSPTSGSEDSVDGLSSE